MVYIVGMSEYRRHGMRIKAGYGYWKTDSYPIGGCFARAGESGVEIARITREFKPSVKGCNREALTTMGEKIAFHTEHTE
jgi:hypothetical protein